MREYNRIILSSLLAILSLLPVLIYSQGKNSNDSVAKEVNYLEEPVKQKYQRAENVITFNVAKMLFANFAFSYERRLTELISLQTELGYQYAIESHDHSGMGNPFYSLMPFLPGRGYTVEGGPKIYPSSNHPKFYITPWATFKYMWCTDVTFHSNVYEGQDDWHPYGNNTYQVYGASCRVGILKTTRHFALDFYAGAGIKIRNNHYELYGYWDETELRHVSYNPDGSPVYTQKTTAYLTVNVGLRLGASW